MFIEYIKITATHRNSNKQKTQIPESNFIFITNILLIKDDAHMDSQGIVATEKRD